MLSKRNLMKMFYRKKDSLQERNECKREKGRHRMTQRIDSKGRMRLRMETTVENIIDNYYN